MKKSVINLNKKNNNKGQVELSFGMIFAIILIIAFLAFAVFAIIKFMQLADGIKIGTFKKNLNEDVGQIWQGSGGVNVQKSYTLPGKVNYACFIDYSSSARGPKNSLYGEMNFNDKKKNLVLYPTEAYGQDSVMTIDNMDIKKTTMEENPYCVGIAKGKLTLFLNKEYGGTLVSVSRK